MESYLKITEFQCQIVTFSDF